MVIIQKQPFILPLAKLPESVQLLTMLWIPPGDFLMGSPKDEPGRIGEDEQQFEVKLSRGFWLGKHLVTQAQWQAIMNNNPSHFCRRGPDYPVENVNWYQAMRFCQKLNELFYNILPKGFEFSLPTEAQWEYSCRAGTQSVYHSGDQIDDLSSVAWHKGNSLGQTHPVGQKNANAWGLYDMHGNVAEWCFDSPPEVYPISSQIDWTGNGDGYLRNVRGGGWRTSPSDPSLRCACRIAIEPNVERPWIGFRLSLGTTNLTT